jgi:transposase InsO family protein
MPWKGVTVNEVRQRFLEDFRLGFYSVSELADRFDVSRRTAHKWIRRLQLCGENGFHELSRRPYNSPSQTPHAIAQELVSLRKVHPAWGARKLLDLMHRRNPHRQLPSPSTACRVLLREGLVRTRRRFRRAHPGRPISSPHSPNDVWAADYKGQFRLGNSSYCFPLTVSDLASRFILGVDAHPEISLEKTQRHFTRLFQEFGLPLRIRTDNGVPFASSALARLSALSVWFIKLGIFPELIQPGRPQQNAVHERMHRTLKREATVPPASSLRAQQLRFDRFRQQFNLLRPHESLAMKPPAHLYRPSTRPFPHRLRPYDYPSHFLVRRVSRDGTIRVLSNQIFISNTLQADFVGLEEVDDGIYDLYFCFIQIGRYLLHPNKIEDIVSRVPVRRRQIDLAQRLLPMS